MTIATTLSNWAGNVSFQATRLHRPRGRDELCAVVASAPRIRAIGSGHSFSSVGDTTAELVRLDRMDDSIDIGTGARTVRVPAGATYHELATALHRAGLALPNMASLPHISVAGSCATGTHGSGARLRGLAAAVRAVQLIGPRGELVELDRERDPHDFPGAVVALGALGIVTSLTLDVEPAYEVAQSVRVGVPLDEIESEAEAVFAAAYSTSVFTDWRSGRANVFLKRRTDRVAGDWAGGRAATRPMHPVPGEPADNCTEQLGRPGPWHERLTHFRPDFIPGSGRELQSEFFVPMGLAMPAIAAVRGIAAEVAPVLQISELRADRGDDLWLSPAYRRDSLALHFTWVDDEVAVRPVMRSVERRLGPFGVRPHWGKLTAIAPRDIAAAYPRAADFGRLSERFDPTGKFRNPFTDALFPRV